MIFNTIIVNHSGRYYRFIRQADQSLDCQVCYWKGQVIPPDDDHPEYRAYVEQKYAPYRKIWAEGTLDTESKALDWVAQHLNNDELVEKDDEEH